MTDWSLVGRFHQSSHQLIIWTHLQNYQEDDDHDHADGHEVHNYDHSHDHDDDHEDHEAMDKFLTKLKIKAGMIALTLVMGKISTVW